ncbi:unnamed protein product [Cunninghamella blakesleeana]
MSTITNIQKMEPHQEVQYTMVDNVLSASNHYEVLGVDKNVSTEDIRKAYLQRSRLCHPDKIPNHPQAAESFRRLVVAHETLVNSSTRIEYDLDEDKSKSLTNYIDKDTAQDIFEKVVHQLYTEIIDGDFQTMRVILSAMSEAHPQIITDDMIDQTESAFQKIRSIINTTHHCYKTCELEIMKIYNLQQEMRLLSIFDVRERIRLIMAISKLILELPINLVLHLLLSIRVRQEGT